MNFVHAKIRFFFAFFWFLFSFCSFPLLKGRQNPLSISKCVKFMKNLIGLYFRIFSIFRFLSKLKKYLMIQFSQIGLVLSNKCQ